MELPRILYITRYSPTSHLRASMVHSYALLERYADSMVWYSTKLPQKSDDLLDVVPFEYGTHVSRPAGQVFRQVRQFLNLGPWARVLGMRAARFGRAENVDLVWAELAYETVVAGRTAAKALGIPLIVTIHDEPLARLAHKNYPNWIRKIFAENFRRTLTAASSWGVISQAMADTYQKRYGIHPTVVYVGVDEKAVLPAKKLNLRKRPLFIGSVGSVVSDANWRTLIEAVSILNERHGIDQIRILHIGELPGNSSGPSVETTGWLSGKALNEQLARIDVCFLNLWFEAEFEESGKTAFPTKIHSYVQAQRPMVALGPAGCSVVRFVEEYACGTVCTVSDSNLLADRLEELLFDARVYNQALVGVQGLRRIFTREAFYDGVSALIDGTLVS